MSGRVIVVGSVNLDLVLRCEHLPRPGETVLADSIDEVFGGKGANQAVAAARLGAAVTLVAAVGDDEAGAAARADLTAAGVDLSGLVVAAGQPTGRATVLVDAAAENMVVVAAGANATLTARAVTDRLRRWEPGPADVVLVSGEVPEACAEAAIRAGAGARTVYNLAPFRGLPDWLPDVRPLLVLNQTEAAQATGSTDAEPAAAALSRRFGAVVVTRGSRGALLVDGGVPHDVPAEPVEPVDTTGAGDAFCGAVAAEFAAGWPLERAISVAVRAATFAVTGRGARGALATRADLGPL